MKKILLSVGLVFTLAVSALAQPTVTLMTFESYTFSDQFDTEYGTGKVEDGFQWGGGLEFGLGEVMAIELIYQNMKTTAYYDGYGVVNPIRYKGTLGVNYAMIGATKYMPVSDKVSGFGTFNMGVGWFSPEESLASEDVAKFTLGGKLGVRVKASEKVSLRLHVQLFSPVQWAGGGFYFGTGGAGTGVTTGSTIWQWNLGGSLNYRLK